MKKFIALFFVTLMSVSAFAGMNGAQYYDQYCTVGRSFTNCDKLKTLLEMEKKGITKADQIPESIKFDTREAYDTNADFGFKTPKAWIMNLDYEARNYDASAYRVKQLYENVDKYSQAVAANQFGGEALPENFTFLKMNYKLYEKLIKLKKVKPNPKAACYECD